MGVSKVDYFGRTLIDLTNDTVTAESLKEGITAHAKNGEQITGKFQGDDSLIPINQVGLGEYRPITDLPFSNFSIDVGFVPKIFYICCSSTAYYYGENGVFASGLLLNECDTLGGLSFLSLSRSTLYQSVKGDDSARIYLKLDGTKVVAGDAEDILEANLVLACRAVYTWVALG